MQNRDFLMRYLTQFAPAANPAPFAHVGDGGG
jgi:hypothetical protein